MDTAWSLRPRSCGGTAVLWRRSGPTEPPRSPTPRRHHRRADPTAGPGEPDPGLPAHSRRAAQARPPRRSLHDPPDPQAPTDTSRTAASDRYVMAPVPARAGLDHAGRDLLPRRLRDHSQTDLRLVRLGSP